MDTEKPIALVTGATSGIGEACARRLHGAGYRVIITGRNTERLEALKAELSDNALSLVFDVRDREAADAAIASLPAEWQEIEVLVNNAGLALGLEKEYEGDYRDWDTMIDTNIKGLLYMTRAVVPGMVARGKGHVVNIGSVAGDAAYANGNVYCGTKAAVKAITDGLRIDLAETPVRVTLLKPGLVETRFSEVRFHGDTERAANVYKGIVPLTGEDIADAALYAVQAPAHVQIAEMLILATHQASGSVICRK
ncbi:MAG: SDR family NAD(P)-dependent oxidoreductase [Muribaculaceae bacterium]|nr:SDR family NAD(P)-dependent oxidoreductase [Muribaculaceae bacterium]